jgi:hypothetical protein
MALRRVLSLLSVSVIATGSIVAAAPKKDAPKKDATPTPEKAAAPGPAAAGSGSGSGEGSAVQMTEDAPPADMNGTDENPDAPRAVGTEAPAATATATASKQPTGYPVEEALRPITLPQNMSEVSIGPHAQIGDGNAYPYEGADALRARYGITDKIQLGITYVYAGIYPNPADTAASGYNYGAHSGKAIGLDVTVQLQKWIGVKVGVPLYLSPVAASLALGAPIKFHFGDKWAIGGLDDLLNIKISKFAPDFYQEYNNALAAYDLGSNTVVPNGVLRVSAYGVYQAKTNVAVIGRAGINSVLGTGTGSSPGNTMATNGGTSTFLRAGVQWTPRHFIDLGLSLGFDDLGHIGTFGPAALLAVRI